MAISAMQGHTTSNACAFAQYASAVAMSGGKDIIDNMVKEFDSRRKILYDGLCSIDGVKVGCPKGAFYVFADVSAFFGKSYNGKQITGSVSFADALLDCGVAVIPGLAFGDDKCVRLAYAVSNDDICKGIAKIKAFVDALK